MSIFSKSNGFFGRNEKRIIAALSLLAFGLRIPLAFRAERTLAWLPYTDDTFYLFSIARNVAAGRSPSIDGIHLTNGFHPLITFLYVPIFWLCGSDSWLAVRWTFVLNGAIAAISVWAAAYAVRAMEREPNKSWLTAPIIAAAIWVGSYQLFGHTTNGLETGLFSLLLLVAIALYAKLLSDENNGVEPSLSRWIIFGIVLGLTVLARIDAAILVVIFVILLFLQRRTIPALIVGSISLLVSAPWWLYNWISFGSFMPSSGQAENSWPLPPFENIASAAKAISEIATLIVYLPGSLGWPIRTIWTILLLSGLAFAFFRTRLREAIKGFRMKTLFPFFLFALVLVVYYSFFFRAPHFISRYFQPGRIIWSIVVAASVSALWRMNIRKTRPALLIMAMTGICFTTYEYSVVYFPSDRPYEFYDIGIWARQNPNEKIAMLQSGISSFVAPNIINLDGKVNTAALLAHQQGRLAEYLRDENFTYIADLKPFIEDIAAIARKDNLYFDSSGMIGNVQLMKRRGR